MSRVLFDILYQISVANMIAHYVEHEHEMQLARVRNGSRGLPRGAFPVQGRSWIFRTLPM